MKKKLRTELRQDVFDQVVLTHGDTSGKEQKIPHSALGDALPDRFAQISRDGQPTGPAAGGVNQRGQSIAVGVADLPDFRNLAELHQLVPGCDNGDQGSGVHLDRLSPATCAESDRGGIDRGSRREKHVAGERLGSARDDVLPGFE